MARRKRADQTELPLFEEPLRDFPLRGDDEPGDAAAAPGEPPPPPEPAADPVPAAPAVDDVPARPPAPDAPAPDAPASGAPASAGLGDRLEAAAIDLAVHLLMLGAALFATWRMGIALALAVEDWAPFAGLALVFSFFYWVVALAFWGQTPGMARARLEARDADGERLTIGQAIGRWLGALATTLLAGLPLVLAPGGRTLSDRLSGSRTVKLQTVLRQYS